MLEFIDGFRTAQQGHLPTTADYLNLPPKAVKQLNDLSDGNHVYLTLRYLDRYEVVKFTKDTELKGSKVPVERDVLGKGRKNFPCGTCIVTDWNSVQLKEFVCNTGCK